MFTQLEREQRSAALNARHDCKRPEAFSDEPRSHAPARHLRPVVSVRLRVRTCMWQCVYVVGMSRVFTFGSFGCTEPRSGRQSKRPPKRLDDAAHHPVM